jgi:phage gpG-like protein
MERAARMRDLGPVMRVQAASMETRISDAFRGERSPAGEEWPALAESTLEQRAAKLPGARRRSKRTGKLTKGAQAARSRATQPGAIKKLIDTGRLRGSIRVRANRDSIEITGAAYLAVHVDGSENVPKRNPLPVERGSDGAFRLVPAADEEFRKAIVDHINGRAA